MQLKLRFKILLIVSGMSKNDFKNEISNHLIFKILHFDYIFIIYSLIC